VKKPAEIVRAEPRHLCRVEHGRIVPEMTVEVQQGAAHARCFFVSVRRGLKAAFSEQYYKKTLQKVFYVHIGHRLFVFKLRIHLPHNGFRIAKLVLFKVKNHIFANAEDTLKQLVVKQVFAEHDIIDLRTVALDAVKICRIQKVNIPRRQGILPAVEYLRCGVA